MSAKKAERPAKLEKTCPLQKTHSRLHQVHELWHRVAADYSEPDAFVVSVNATLQALRSVSFMLNKESKLIPDFETWYEPHKARYQADPLMRWLKDARNFVEKEGDLDLHSTARVSLLGLSADPLEQEFEISPLLDQEEIASLIAPRLSERVRSAAVLEVERRWVASDLPEHELLDVLAHGYGVVAEVVADAHKQCGTLMQTFGDETHERRPNRRTYLGGRLSCMVAHRELRTAHLHLAKNVLMSIAGRDRTLVRQDVGEPPFDIPQEMLDRDENEDLLAAAGRWVEFAKLVTKEQGFHLPMAMVHETRTDAPSMHQLHATDYQEQLLMMESIASEVERVGAEGVIFIGEFATEEEATNELCVAVATEDGGRKQWLTPIRQTNGGVDIGATQVEDGIVPDFFSPILRAWLRMGRAPAPR